MQKKQKWHFLLILGVLALTIYNILPTIFFYSNPLNSPVSEPRANALSIQIANRINSLESESLRWVKSFCNLLHIEPLSIEQGKDNPQLITVSFSKENEAKLLRQYLPRAGALIPFAPAQLTLYGDPASMEDTVVKIQRNIPIHFDPNQVNSFFQFSTKFNEDGEVTPLYRAIVTDRLVQVALSLGGINQNTQLTEALQTTKDSDQEMELVSILSERLVSFSKTFGTGSDLSKRFFSSFTQGNNKQQLLNVLTAKLQTTISALSKEIGEITQEEAKAKNAGQYLDPTKLQLKELLQKRVSLFSTAAKIVKENSSFFLSGDTPWTFGTIGSSIQQSLASMQENGIQTLSIGDKNPFISSLQVNWRNGTITLTLHPELLALKNQLKTKDQRSFDQVEQFLFNELARTAQTADEKISPSQDNYVIELSSLQNSSGFLAFKLSSIAETKSQNTRNLLLSSWNPKHVDLQADAFPFIEYTDYLNLPQSEQTLCLVAYSPVSQSKAPLNGFRMNSLYLIAKGLGTLLQKAENSPSEESSKLLLQDFLQLRALLYKAGYIGYEGSLLSVNREFAGDFIFECPDYYQNVLAASRENFQVKGSKKFATLEFSNVEQRILAENKIDTQIHEDLLKWRDDYKAASLNTKGVSPLDVPNPTRSVLLSNLKLSAVKYFRGDDRKVLHWGLDLSGGKTVQIELRGSNNELITQESDIKQGINELYGRVNKMGVSEVSIRQEGNLITLDFPGSQNLSAAELVKASSMFFHVVNEKFSPNNTTLASFVQQFLQEVWNEAVVTNRKTPEDINQIAWKHLYGEESATGDLIQSRSEAGRILYEQGLRLANPLDGNVSNLFDDSYSKIAIFRGEDFTAWQGQTHPLLFVFRNFSLEGSDLENVRSSYDPSRGNFLSFGVRGSYTSKDNIKINPRDDFSAWTTPFSKEKVAGTPNGQFSRNLGWRMAVILNGTIVSAPTLDSPLRDSAMITGSFSQREINQLESDLKAGSLSFTPKILSEKNVSPELGSKERSLGIWATIIALALVIGVMIFYYRFGGFIASVAVVFNLLIMWATLQNIQATLTLASLAGLILTIGMAVDANVLIFERIREEFAVTKRISSAIHAGYKKAFSAILDSNVTTIIAALILLQFDSGPIRGFAITLIIGIASSMFTALFATKFFFTAWAQNPKNKSLTLLNLFKQKKLFNFLRHAKSSMIISACVIVLGTALFLTEKSSLFGMDFTGGYALNVELQPLADGSYRQTVEQALIQAGAKAQDIQVRELSPNNCVKIFLSKNLEFLPTQNLPSNPQVAWVLTALNNAQVQLTEASIAQATQNWAEISGQMSQTMRNSAILALLIALVSIFVYIAIRFEFKYAMSATICLVHDLFFSCAALAILHACGVPVQIDLTIIAALMTIAGYSLNDTIIVFDRIREESKGAKKNALAGIVNHSLNVTLSRTILTSGTTLLVLIPLIAMGGSTIFGFSLVMAIGVVFGTLSSLFVAAPLMLFFHKREEEKQQRIALNH